MPIWTQRASFSWRQNVGFYEHRYEVVRDIERKGLLRRFLDRPAQLAIRLEGPHQVISFAPDGLLIGMLTPEANVDVLRAATESIVEALNPDLRSYPLFKFQSLEPCAKSYDEARALAAAAFLGVDHPGRVTDFALSLDGKLEVPFDDYHLQAGIVEAAEATGRLARPLSRGIEDINSPSSLWRPEDLPPVAVFCDVELDVAPLEDVDDIVAAMFSTIASARKVADELRVSMLKPLQGCEL
ncbi:MAG TPA: hypothetical protein VN845_12635 [Solirubrobacteraceae bacterium]|nr:hypothetical protein [Solirubrobacteraceae bacterium]